MGKDHQSKKSCPRCGSYDHHTRAECPTEEQMPKEAEGDPVGDGGGGGGSDPQMIKNYNSSKSNTSAVDGGGKSGDYPYSCKKCGHRLDICKCFSDPRTCNLCGGQTDECACDGLSNMDEDVQEGDSDDVDAVSGGGNGDGKLDAQGSRGSGGGSDPQMIKNYNSSKSNTSAVDGGSLTKNTGKKGPGIVRKGVGKTLGLAKTVIMTAVLISVAGAGVDVYQTYNDAIAIDLEQHITNADFELSDDKSEISGTVGFDIPEMGMFEKSIIASVHVTVLESNPTTNGDYEFEYTLGSGEQFYDFTLDDLDPVTVETIEAGEPLDIEYSGKISVTYLGIKIPSVTMDIPLTTTTVETA